MATIEKVQRREGIVYKAKVRREGHPTTGKSKYDQHIDFWVPRPREILRWIFTVPEKLRPAKPKQQNLW